MAAAEASCKFQKTYTIESKCTGKFLYLIRNSKDNSVREFCVEDLTDAKTIELLEALPKDAVIPI